MGSIETAQIKTSSNHQGVAWAPFVVPICVSALFIGISLSLWVSTVAIGLLVFISLVYRSQGDHQRAYFIQLCAVMFLPALAGWHAVIPLLGVIFFLVFIKKHRPWPGVFRVHYSMFFENRPPFRQKGTGRLLLRSTTVAVQGTEKNEGRGNH